MSAMFHGVYAAALTPRDAAGRVDVHALRRLLSELVERGVDGIAVNGATGEFCLTSPDDLRLILHTAQEVCAQRAKLFSGVGAAGLASALELAATASEFAVDALLLPMPYFFPYEQCDLEAFCRSFAARTQLPTLLYNLPQFSSGLEAETARQLIEEVPNIIGIKDSSGSLDILRYLTNQQVKAVRIIGNDGALAAALQEKVCDAVVSGVACALPELIQTIFRQAQADPAFISGEALAELGEFISLLDRLPTPWGIKFAVETRGWSPADFSLPVSPSRRETGAELDAWMGRWLTATKQSIRP